MKVFNEMIQTKDLFSLDVKIMEPDEATKKTVIMCHGLTSNKEGRKNQLHVIAENLCSNG